MLTAVRVQSLLLTAVCVSVCATPHRTPEHLPDPSTESELPVLPDPSTESELPVLPDPNRDSESPVLSDPDTESESPVLLDPNRDSESPVLPDPTSESESPILPDPTSESESPIGLLPDPNSESESPVLPDPNSASESPGLTDPNSELESPGLTDQNRESESPGLTDQNRESETPVLTNLSRESESPVLTNPNRESESPLLPDPNRESESPVLPDPKRESESPVLPDPNRESESSSLPNTGSFPDRSAAAQKQESPGGSVTRRTGDGDERTGRSTPDPQRSDTLQLFTRGGAAEDDRRASTDPGQPTVSWTEADPLRTAAVSVPASQELGTEATMSSEDLPLIFEPFEDVTPAVAMQTAGDAEQTVSMETKRRPSDAGVSVTQDTTQSDDVTLNTITHQPLLVFRPQTDTEDQESKEEADEEEEEMDSDEEEEEESEEDLSESTVTAHTRPPYSLIPPPPVWVQRNQGLVRSWVELIREKAGYVSGMLAPVGIGIAGALLLVGALYSIRLIHRKRRDSFKHQRRKPPREVRSGPDNAMLLADSSEDEF